MLSNPRIYFTAAALAACCAAGSVVSHASSPAGVPALSAVGYSVAQDAGSLTVSVNRVGGSAGSLRVSYATRGGTAVSGVDFTSTHGTLSWANGETAAKAIAVPISNAKPFSGTKTLTISLSGAKRSVSGSQSNATVTIE